MLIQFLGLYLTVTHDTYVIVKKYVFIRAQVIILCSILLPG